MGAVYLAEDAKLGRKVAIKTMRPELAAQKENRDRFAREARAAANVESDYIVPILHVGEAADGTPFIAMPFLKGEMLDARMKREPVAPSHLIADVPSRLDDMILSMLEKLPERRPDDAAEIGRRLSEIARRAQQASSVAPVDYYALFQEVRRCMRADFVT